MLTLPTNMSLKDWADQAVLDLSDFGSFSKLQNPDLWQDWAIQFLSPISLGGFTIPVPYDFGDWREWADRLCGELA